ncbi:TetR family transcriptional regulator C-terminal domain-containing protein [Leucobacter sp. CSA1]|uniref:TetR family transcriptional regulator C-terminal domain-containing protein n=1 Tax=Leucobacter chromiisoli TaxID=2796471 RepID=A0A934Q6W5_9MICO|nr:TetR/AcrR family transcriptional regulator [Leucobacter chromiisoli]MBK0418480.1 TetR family transcriptional regulator C-terminal domain-containing protein [Leucobacter chromiisoli]
MAEDGRERILAACARIIASSGLAGFRMSEVAREAGVSIGLLAYHFGDRDGLLQAALDEVNASAARRAEVQPDARTPAERLAALLCSEFGEEPGIREGSTTWNELRSAAVFDAERAAAVSRSTADWQRRARELLAEADPEGDAEAGALMLTALVEGLSGRWLTGQIDAARAQSAVRAAIAALMP